MTSEFSTISGSLTAVPVSKDLKMQANESLKNFRLESNLSWRRFSELYTEICAFVAAPSSDALFGGRDAREYKFEIRGLIDELLHNGHFAPGTGAKWIFGRHKDELYLAESVLHNYLSVGEFSLTISRLVDYITRLTEYAITKVKEQIPIAGIGPGPRCGNVSEWLMDGRGGNWDHVGVRSRKLYGRYFLIRHSLAIPLGLASESLQTQRIRL